MSFCPAWPPSFLTVPRNVSPGIERTMLRRSLAARRRRACAGSGSTASISTQLHTPDPAVPYTESIGALNALRSEGKIRHIGVSNLTPDQLAVARTITNIATVQSKSGATASRAQITRSRAVLGAGLPRGNHFADSRRDRRTA